MNETKLTIRVPRDLVENAKIFAEKNHTTLTKLIESFLYRIPSQSLLDKAPIVRRLSGSMSADVSIQDYYNHLEEKYGR